MESLEVRNYSFASSVSDDKNLRVEGLVNSTEKWSKELGRKKKFIEKVEAGVFAKALKRGKNINLLLEHDPGNILASVENRNLTLYEDGQGLKMVANLTNKGVYEAVKAKEYRNMSFGFKVIKDDWKKGINGVYRRIIKEIELREVSIVKNPAYSQSVIEARGIDGEIEIPKEILRKLEGEIKMEERSVQQVQGEATIGGNGELLTVQKVESILLEDSLKILSLIEWVPADKGIVYKLTLENETIFNENKIVEIGSKASAENKSFNKCIGSISINKNEEYPIIEQEYEKMIHSSLCKSLVVELSNQFSKDGSDILKAIDQLSFNDIGSIAFLSVADWEKLYNLKDASGEKIIKIKDGSCYFEGIKVVASEGIKNSFILDPRKVKAKYRNISEIKRIVNTENSRAGKIELVQDMEVCFI